MADDLARLRIALSGSSSGDAATLNYERAHRILAEGNFVLTVCEGRRSGEHVALYDLFRVENDQIVEHWDTTEAVPPLSEWRNDNGKF